MARSQLELLDRAGVTDLPGFQRIAGLKPDNVVGPLTTRALEIAAAYTNTNAGWFDCPASTKAMEIWLDRIVFSGSIGYATPQMRDSDIHKLAVQLRHPIDRMSPSEVGGALKRYGTAHTLGGCGSFIERSLAYIIQCGRPTSALNQSISWINPKARAKHMSGINDNVPATIVSGTAKSEHDGRVHTLHGFAECFGGGRSVRSPDIGALMLDYRIPLLVIHQSSGHVSMIIAISLPGVAEKGTLLRVAQDGSSKEIGKPVSARFWWCKPSWFDGRGYIYPLFWPGQHRAVCPDALPPEQLLSFSEEGNGRLA